MKRYRLVDELYLDCINRGKIDNMVGCSVTHTQTTFKINKQRDMLLAECMVEVRARVRCARLAISMLTYG